MLRSEPRRWEQLPGRLSLISHRRAGLGAGPLPVALALVALAHAGGALAHGPATSIGRAVEAFHTVPVSYEPGASVSDVEAGNFPTIVGSDTKVAFLSAGAAAELAGGPDAIAEEIAREAALDGTLVVLVGTGLGAWSEEIEDERLAELVRKAQATGGASPAAKVEALVRSVQAEPTGGTPWALLVAIALVLACAAFVALLRLRPRPRAES